jgi:transcriptional repressor NrdR
MQCKYCNYPESRVVQTNKDFDLNQIYRRRECIKCGKRFSTQEHFRENYKRPSYMTQPPQRVLAK